MIFLSYRKTLLFAAVAGALTLSTSMAHAHRGDAGMRGMLKQLDLDLIQRQDVRQMFRDGVADSQAFRADMGAIQRQVQALVQQSSLDTEQVLSLLRQRQVLAGEQGLKRAHYHHRLWTILDDTQRDKFADLTQQRMHREPPTLLNRLEKLDLSESQRKTVANIESGFATQRDTLIARIREAKMQEHTLIRSEGFSEQQWQTLYQTYQQDFLNLALLSAQTRHQVWQVLDEQQRQTVRDHSQHRSHHRNRARAQDFLI